MRTSNEVRGHGKPYPYKLVSRFAPAAMWMRALSALGDEEIRFHSGLATGDMNIEHDTAGQGIGEGKLAFTLKLPNLLVCHNGVDHLLYVQWAGQVIWKKAAFCLSSFCLSRAGAGQQGLTGAKPQFAAADFKRFVEQFINMNIV